MPRRTMLFEENMDVDLAHKIKTLPRLHHALIPVFEAISNSIDAIEDRENGRGQIIVKIIRERTKPTAFKEDISGDLEIEKRWPEIRDFIIEDNGIGFTDKNWKSFNRSESGFKGNRGGKGVGRFNWLIAFNKAEVSSVYQENGKRWLREFEFTTTKEVDPKSLRSTDKEIRTIVKLKGFKKEYQKDETAYKKTRTIAQRILEHFLAFYINKNVPEIIIEDDHEKTKAKINLDELYLGYHIEPDLFEISGRSFLLHHVELSSTSIKEIHQIVYCANKRDVKTKNLTRYLGTSRFKIGERFVYYSAYVSSEYLDQKVNNLRSTFDFPDKDSQGIDGDYELSYLTIQNKIIERIKIYLADHLEEIERVKRDQVDKITSENPWLKRVSESHPEIYEEIKPGFSESEIIDVLYKKKGRDNSKVIEGSKALLTSKAQNYDEIKEEQERITKELFASKKDDLIGYMVWRKLIIDLLDKKIQLNKDNKYERESSIHNIIFPMNTTTNQIDYEEHNLWIIDENLTFHNFAASDPHLNKISTSKSSERPDIIIFSEMDPKTRIAGAVSIIEFKKPMRKDFDKNPVRQLYSKVREIRGEDIELSKGRTLHVDDSTKIYCYAICDMTQEIKNFAEDSGYSKLRNELGYYTFNPNHKAHTEIIDFDKLLADVRNRHKVFFERLGIEG